MPNVKKLSVVGLASTPADASETAVNGESDERAIPDVPLEEFGSMLKAWRRGRLTQEELAIAAGIERSTLARWEQGLVHNAQPKKLRALQEALERLLGIEKMTFYAILDDSIARAL